MIKLEAFDTTLDRIIADRMRRNEQSATYRVNDVRYAELRPARCENSPPSLWLNGRYVGEMACRELPIADGSVTVWGRFRHLSFVIEGVA